MAVWDSLLSDNDRKYLAKYSGRKRSGFGEHPALIVIDMNIGAVGENRPIPEQLDKYPGACGPFAWAAIPYQQKLIAASREAGIPVIYSKNVFRPIHDLPRAKDPTYLYSELNAQSEIHPELAPRPDDLLIEKQGPSVFFQTPLLLILLHKKIDTLILLGNSTSGCVRATAVDAGCYPGFKVAVVEECVFDRLEISHRAAMFDLSFKYCDVVKFTEAMDYLVAFRNTKAKARLTSSAYSTRRKG